MSTNGGRDRIQAGRGIALDTDWQAARVARAKARAVRLLTHYVRMPWEAAGLKWDGDNDGEMEALVDELIEAAVSMGKLSREASGER